MIHYLQKDEQNRVNHLMFLNRQVLEVFCQNHNILLLDCTYKTNRYWMPLLNMVFVTNMHTMMNLGFGFMSKEKSDDYL